MNVNLIEISSLHVYLFLSATRMDFSLGIFFSVSFQWICGSLPPPSIGCLAVCQVTEHEHGTRSGHLRKYKKNKYSEKKRNKERSPSVLISKKIKSKVNLQTKRKSKRPTSVVMRERVSPWRENTYLPYTVTFSSPMDVVKICTQRESERREREREEERGKREKRKEDGWSDFADGAFKGIEVSDDAEGGIEGKIMQFPTDRVRERGRACARERTEERGKVGEREGEIAHRKFFKTGLSLSFTRT